MAFYSITYNPSQIKNYNKLQQGINAVSASAWIKPVDGQFIIRTTYVEKAVLDALAIFIDKDDALFIAKLDTPHWVSRNINKDLMTSLGENFL